jgi:acyl carrier protein
MTERKNDIEGRVLECFANVFPDVPRDELPRVSHRSLAQWDSVAHVILLAALSEEFQIEFDYQTVEEMSSFALVVDFVRTQHVTQQSDR